MIFNLLTDLTDPDNTPSGYTTIDPRFIITIALTLIAIAITIVSAYIICYLYKNCNNEEIKNKTWIKPTVIVTAIAITILIVVLACLACSKY